MRQEHQYSLPSITSGYSETGFLPPLPRHVVVVVDVLIVVVAAAAAAVQEFGGVAYFFVLVFNARVS